MASMIPTLIETLEQMHRLEVVKKPNVRPAIHIPVSAVAATIMGGTQLVVPIEKLIETLKERAST